MRRLHSCYRGVHIWRQSIPGRLRWYTIVPNLAADTLAGIKELIRKEIDK